MEMLDYRYASLLDGYWKNKQEANKRITTKAIWNRFVDTGRIAAFDFNWQTGDDNKPHIFWDSDVAKWIEAVAYILHDEYIPEFAQYVESLIDKIEEHQGDDGYFNVYFTVCEPEQRFLGRTNHELYCAGHLIEAAVAYYEATGKDRLLKAMLRYADYIYTVFVDERSAAFTTPGHEEIELALVRLYRCTKNSKYLELAQFFVDERGVREEPVYDYALPEYAQSHLPVRQQHTAEGHAVRACYLYAGMADVAKETHDQDLLNACRDIFLDIITNKMYVTGGIGSSHIGEAFTVPYDLPNDAAYNETCASIAMCLFARAMQALDNRTIYADIIEKELYNSMMSGLALSSDAFFYENPLEINRRNYVKNTATKEKERYPIAHRKEVFDTSCCPPNINRTIASVQRYIFGVDEDTVYVYQFMGSEMNYGKKRVRIETDYPNDGVISVSCENVPKLMIRIPYWCDQYHVDCDCQVVDNYICVDKPETVRVNFVMKPVLIEANPLVFRNNGKVAVQYGPVVYCMESVDNTDNIYSLYIDANSEIRVEYSSEFRMNTLKAKGWKKDVTNMLYRPLTCRFEEIQLNLVPYSCHANRGDTDMLVWINLKR